MRSCWSCGSTKASRSQGKDCFDCLDEAGAEAAGYARLKWHVYLEILMSWGLGVVGVALVGFVTLRLFFAD